MSNNNKNLIAYPTSKYLRGIEAGIEIVFNLLGVFGTYIVFNWLGKYIFDSDFSSETLFSLLLFPALYILKSADEIVSPIFVNPQWSVGRSVITMRLRLIEKLRICLSGLRSLATL